MSILKTLGFIGFSAVIGMGVGFGMSDSKHKKEKEEFNNIKTEQDQEISDLTNALNEKTSTILLLEEQIETLNSELALNVVELAEKQSLLAEKQNELEIARNTITDNQINISELEVQVVNLQSQIGSLENENENLTSQVERLQAQLNELQKITFTIHTFEDDLFTYNATENMNFDEWINSEYNSNAVFIYSINDESNLIVSIIGDNTFYLTDSNGNYLTSETKIENGTRYILTDVSPNKTTQINFVVEYDDPNTYELTQTTLNLYGHTHQVNNFYQGMPYMYHVGVDSHNCYPVLLDDIIEEMKAQMIIFKNMGGLE